MPRDSTKHPELTVVCQIKGLLKFTSREANREDHLTVESIRSARGPTALLGWSSGGQPSREHLFFLTVLRKVVVVLIPSAVLLRSSSGSWTKST